MNESGTGNITQAPDPAPAGGGFFASVADIFVEPNKVFARIDRGLQWWKPFILIAAVVVIMTYLMIPVNIHVASLNERGVDEEQLEMMMENIEKFSFVGLIVAPLGVLVIYLILGFIVNISVNLLSGRSDYKKSLSLVSFVGLIPVVEQIISTVIIRMRGMEQISSSADARISISLAPLFSDLGSAAEALLESLSVFSIWYYIVLAIGISAIFRIDLKKSFIPVVILWIISFGFIYLGKVFGGGVG